MTPGELRQRRHRMGLTQAQLARALAVQPNTIARWERGTIPMGNSALLRFLLTYMAEDLDRAGGDPEARRAVVKGWLDRDRPEAPVVD